MLIPTRARGSDNPHTLDLVITNDTTVDNIEYMAPLGNSYHYFITWYKLQYYWYFTSTYKKIKLPEGWLQQSKKSLEHWLGSSFTQ